MRTFLAIELPESLRQAIGAASKRAREELPRARWIPPENLHLTLHFFGERDVVEVERIAAALSPLFASSAPFELRIDHSGAFPRSRPRVVWLGLEEQDGGSRRLERLHGDIQETLSELGEAADARAFRPHLTVARCKDRWGSPDLDRAHDLFGDLAGASFSVTEAVLMASRLERSGAVYRAFEVLPLAATARL